jgi:peptide/nickel transport system permease protein
VRFLIRRLALYAVAAWASLTLSFLIPRLAPGDPAQAMAARFAGKISPEGLAALRESLGASDAPLPVQYATFVGRTMRGDLGVSSSHFPARVSSVIAGGLGWTVLLAGTAVLISVAIGSLLGMLAAWRRGGWLDSVGPPVLALLGAFPYFFLAMVLLYFLAFQQGLFPMRHAYAEGMSPSWSLDFLVSIVRHAILPGACIVISSAGGWLLSMRNSMIAVLREDYVTLAQAKGLAPRTVMLRYAARNALLPNLTGFGMALGFVLSGSLLTEFVFSYPGLGYLLIEAVRNQDYPLMQGLFLTVTLAVLIANLAVDVLAARLDPRVSDATRAPR